VCLLSSGARDRRERTMIEVLYGTGARAGEVRNMRVEDVDLLARRDTCAWRVWIQICFVPLGQFPAIFAGISVDEKRSCP